MSNEQKQELFIVVITIIVGQLIFAGLLFGLSMWMSEDQTDVIEIDNPIVYNQADPSKLCGLEVITCK